MRFAFAALLLLHGLIHFMGFAKAFGLARLDQLKLPISRPLGIVWLVAGLAMATTAALVLGRFGSWHEMATAALLLSQAVIVSSWNDARFGTLANLVILIPVIVAFAQNREGAFRAAFEKTAAGIERSASASPLPLTETAIASLPSAVQRYLRVTGAVGRPGIARFRLEFEGAMKQRPDGPWLKIRARQHSLIRPSVRAFHIESSLYGLPFEGLHLFEGPHATMQIDVAGLVRVVDARGPQMDQSETVTLLNDMCLLAPASLVDPRIEWEVLSDREVEAKFTHQGRQVSAVLTFAETGLLLDFRSDDRLLSADGKEYAAHRWSTPVRDYAEFGGRKVVARAEAVWHLPAGPFPYARFDLVDYEAR
jgi:hypothetical protein